MYVAEAQRTQQGSSGGNIRGSDGKWEVEMDRGRMKISGGGHCCLLLLLLSLQKGDGQHRLAPHAHVARHLIEREGGAGATLRYPVSPAAAAQIHVAVAVASVVAAASTGD